MSAAASPITDVCAITPADIAARVRRLGLAVPALVVLAGSLVSLQDPRFGLLAGAILLGWTRLVGL